MFPDGPFELQGYNSVAAVAAVLHNQRSKTRPLTALQVVQKHNLNPDAQLGLTSALALLQKVLGTAPASGRNHPWEPGARAGHYAVFCVGRPHALYSHRNGSGHFYLYDPIAQRDWQLSELSSAGLAPLVAYLFPDAQ